MLVTVIDTLRPSPYPLPEAVAYFALFEVGAPVLVGRLVRARADLVAQLRERRAELEREHAGAAAAARAAERLALGRKLDELVIAGVEALIKDAGEESKAAAVRIETRARSLLEEMRSLLQELSSPV